MITFLVDTDGDLQIIPDPEFTEENFGYLREMPTTQALCEIFEGYTCNGWDCIQPEEIGALTSAPILSSDVSRNDDGEIVDYANLFYHERYAIEDPIDMLLKGETVIFNNCMK
jgi:hypothetical protein